LGYTKTAVAWGESLKVLTAAEMRTVDREAIKGYGIPSPVLMERAGLAVARRVRELYPEKRAFIFAGSGNNGGDGLVVARELSNAGMGVRVVIAGKRDRMSKDASLQLSILKKMNIPVEFRQKVTPADLHGSVFVDALFGTGLSKKVSGQLARTMEFVNSTDCPVVAVDIPSGIDSDTGQVMGAAFRADATVTFGTLKRGLVLHPGASHAGRVTVEDIGFPPVLFDSSPCMMMDACLAAAMLPEREAYSHKGDYGHVLVVAGSRGKTGAALLTARGVLRYGAGLATLGVPESLIDVFQAKVKEEMTLPLPSSPEGAHSADGMYDTLKFLDEKADVLAIGPGLGTSEGAIELVRGLVVRSTAPMVIDADAVNALSGKAAILKRAKAPVILTPHPGEFARLAVKSRNDIEADRVNAAQSFAKQYGVYVVLKGVPTISAGPEGQVFINPTGNPGMATAGAGDVLTGAVAAFLAQGLHPLEAAALGAYMHGLAGDIAACGGAEHSLVARDLAETAPEAFAQLRGMVRA